MERREREERGKREKKGRRRKRKEKQTLCQSKRGNIKASHIMKG
ncbi:hypothetical protein [Streptococcus pyogenes]|nr:hypothetical protein [Streptococcus pyogenes]